MTSPVPKRDPQLLQQAPEFKRNYELIFDKIVEDAQKDPAGYINNWIVPGGAE